MEPNSSINPEISIVVPVYKVERYLPKCIESLLAQTLANIEIILVDDGSPDRCGEICDAYAATDARIRVIHKTNEGVSAARNDGIAVAKAPVIGFVDSDDWIEPDMYEVLLKALKDSDADMAVCNVWYDYADHCRPDAQYITEARTVSRDEALRLLVEDKVIHNYPWDKIFRKEVLKDLFTEDIRYEDIVVMVRWVANIKKMAMTPYRGYHYVQRSDSYLHSQSEVQITEYISALKSQLEFLKSRNLVPDCWDSFMYRIVREGVIYSKYIAYENLPKQTIYARIKSIADLIRPYQHSVERMLGKKHRRRLHNLLNNPRLFVRSMKWNQRYHLVIKSLTSFRKKPEHRCFD